MEITRKLLALGKLDGVGRTTLEKLAAQPDIADVAVEALADTNPRIARALTSADAWPAALAAADADLGHAERTETRILSVLDADYPVLLRQTPDRPFFLYVRGQWAQPPSRSVAVIGTRTPTEHGRLVAERITEYLVADGWSIVSGLALGCDRIAHEAALRAGGHTVAVLAHGLQTVAPRQHAKLAEQIVEQGGALVTEYAYGVEPFPHQFVKRDRIQAGLAAGVIMIQSDLEGGSLHASRQALAYGRILAVPHPTARDIANQEVKIQANLVLCGNDARERAQLLHCDEQDLGRVFVINGKADYEELARRLEQVIGADVGGAERQGSLFGDANS
ncbi:MAG: DNA-protecting protein DprA [Caldilinea sp.]|nr:DNA-protecting protein DprA [Caldilinea sp.]